MNNKISKRTCKKCNATKALDEKFYRLCAGRDRVTLYFKHTCRDCERAASKAWGAAHAEHRKQYTSDFTKKNPNYNKQWKLDNKEHTQEYRKEYESRLHVKLKKRMSRRIRHVLKSKSIIKSIPVVDFLPYTVGDLKQHLESQFESWMRWDNWGSYNNQTWNDRDSSTWTWNIDHIIPLASFNISSETDEEFLKAWNLTNLRPLKSKENIILGAKMKRIQRGLNGS